MNKVEQGIFAVVFVVVFSVMFMWFTKPDVRMLVAGLDDWKRPKDAANHKSYLRSPLSDLIAAKDKAVGPLTQTLHDKDRKVNARIAAAIALAHIKKPESLPELLAELGTDEEKLYEHLAESIKLYGKDAFPELKKVMYDGPELAGERAAYVTVKCKPTNNAVFVLQEMIKKNKSAKIRKASVIALGKLKKSTQAVLGQALAGMDKDPSVREAAKEAISKRPKKMIVTAAQGMIVKQEASQRLLAVLMVKDLQEADAKVVLMKGFRDKDLEVAIASAAAFGGWFSRNEDARTTKEVKERLEDLLELAKNDVQLMELGKAAGKANIHELTGFFDRWLKEGTPGKKAAALHALSWLGDQLHPEKVIVYVDDPNTMFRTAVLEYMKVMFHRGKKEWGRFHYSKVGMPSDPVVWKTWWKIQKDIYEMGVQAKKQYDLGYSLLSTDRDAPAAKKYAAYVRAEKELRKGQDLLIKIQDVHGINQEGFITKFQKLINHAMHDRPTGHR